MKTIIIMFGITGDLSKRKLLPALETTYLNIPHPFELIGVSRKQVEAVDVVGEESNLRDITSIVTMDLDDEKAYKRLWDERIAGQDAQVLVYLAVPPLSIDMITTHLASAGFAAPNVKVLLEKPFGFDVRSSEQLFHTVTSLFDEQQLYFVDHYLGKRVAREIVSFRETTKALDKVWNREAIERIEIIASEKLDVEGRAAFYEQTGALRDVLQGHLMQLLALTIADLSEPTTPLSLARSRAIKGLLPAEPEQSIRGQYEGYREEVGSPNSQIETYAEMTLYSEDPIWQGIPMTLVTGKSLDEKQTVVRVYFKETHHLAHGCLTFGLQPETGISVTFEGSNRLEESIEKAVESYSLREGLKWDGYEAIFIDALLGDKTYFVTKNEVIASWQAVDNVLNNWQLGNPILTPYEKGASIKAIRALAAKHPSV